MDKKISFVILRRKKLDFILHVAPAILIVLVFLYIPFFLNIVYSLTEWNGFSKEPHFIGFDNFRKIFIEDAGFKNALIFTIKYLVLYVASINILALITAVTLEKFKSKSILAAALYIPCIFSQIIVGFIWKFIFFQGFDSFYKITGLEFFDYSWLGRADLVFYSIIVVSVWQSIGFFILIYIAGLRSIPQDLTEACIMDGASSFKSLFYFKIPLLMPSITACVFISIVNSIKQFDIIFTLTAGGPGNVTTNILYNIYKDAFQYNLYGYATAKSLVVLIFVLVLTYFQVKIFKSKEIEV